MSKRSMLKLTGFDNFLESIQEAGANLDNEGRKCFEKCAENLYDALYKYAESAGLDQRLLDEIEERFSEEYGIWSYEVGWKKQRNTTKNPIPDTYKVIFYNYGTPKRTTKAGYNRGAEKGRGFIKKAKLSAVRTNKKLQKETLDKILGELKK